MWSSALLCVTVSSLPVLCTLHCLYMKLFEVG